jgi:hypothetical protein
MENDKILTFSAAATATGGHIETAGWLGEVAELTGYLHSSGLDLTQFSPTDVVSMYAILGYNPVVPPNGNTHLKDHVEHCFWQMARFANLARLGKGFKGVQFGLNLGRVQELLGSYGGVEAWWRTFEPLIVAENWAQLQATTERYLKLLCLNPPSSEFVNRV